MTDPTAPTPAADAEILQALLRERDGYIARGLGDRVAQVDEQLRLHGRQAFAAQTPQAAPPKTAAKTSRRRPS